MNDCYLTLNESQVLPYAVSLSRTEGEVGESISFALVDVVPAIGIELLRMLVKRPFVVVGFDHYIYHHSCLYGYLPQKVVFHSFPYEDTARGTVDPQNLLLHVLQILHFL